MSVYMDQLEFDSFLIIKGTVNAPRKLRQDSLSRSKALKFTNPNFIRSMFASAEAESDMSSDMSDMSGTASDSDSAAYTAAKAAQFILDEGMEELEVRLVDLPANRVFPRSRGGNSRSAASRRSWATQPKRSGEDKPHLHHRNSWDGDLPLQLSPQQQHHAHHQSQPSTPTSTYGSPATTPFSSVLGGSRSTTPQPVEPLHLQQYHQLQQQHLMQMQSLQLQQLQQQFQHASWSSSHTIYEEPMAGSPFGDRNGAVSPSLNAKAMPFQPTFMSVHPMVQVQA